MSAIAVKFSTVASWIFVVRFLVGLAITSILVVSPLARSIIPLRGRVAQRESTTVTS